MEGKTFKSWSDGETDYAGGEAITTNLTLQATFDESFAVTFVIPHESGDPETLTQYFRNTGEAIGTMPQDPFIAGKVFEKWVDQATGNEVTAATIVNDSMTVVLDRNVVSSLSDKDGDWELSIHQARPTELTMMWLLAEATVRVNLPSKSVDVPLLGFAFSFT